MDDIKEFIGIDGLKYYKCLDCGMVFNFEPAEHKCDVA